ncbi:hypothetical protein CK221_17585 [Mesorhizobium sp. WSM3868]|nr:hypothetical protein CK221_17585 [Mesorhizobium sp. WSM3868]
MTHEASPLTAELPHALLGGQALALLPPRFRKRQEPAPVGTGPDCFLRPRFFAAASIVSDFESAYIR